MQVYELITCVWRANENAGNVISVVQFLIIFKILLFTFKAVDGLAPSYLSELLEAYVPSRILSSSMQLLLHEPKLNLKTYGSRAFSDCAPRLWNSLPLEIRRCDSIDTFKKKLKRHLFKSSYFC